jgi:hypothetical protein
MRKHQHTTNNVILEYGPSVGVFEERAIPATRAMLEPGIKGFLTFWKPSLEEIELIRQGKPIALLLAGDDHPRVKLMVGIST